MCVWSCTSTLPCFSRCAVKLNKENTSSSLKKAVEENCKNGVRMCTANVISLLDCYRTKVAAKELYVGFPQWSTGSDGSINICRPHEPPHSGNKELYDVAGWVPETALFVSHLPCKLEQSTTGYVQSEGFAWNKLIRKGVTSIHLFVCPHVSFRNWTRRIYVDRTRYGRNF